MIFHCYRHRCSKTTFIILLMCLSFYVIATDYDNDDDDDYFEPSRVIYFMHMHKVGGTKLCNYAKELGHVVVGMKNCGPTFPDVLGKHAVESLTHQLDPSNTLPVVQCVDRRPPDKCNPWLRVNPFDMIRIWPVQKYKSSEKSTIREVEIPMWNFHTPEEMDRVLESAGGPTFVANERYLSRADQIRLHEEQDYSKTTYCYVAFFRDPLDRAYSHWKHDDRSNIDLPRGTQLGSYLENYARDNLMTRSMCGETCKDVRMGELTEDHYDIALRNVQAFDAVLITENYEDSLNLLEHKCPSKSIPLLNQHDEQYNEDEIRGYTSKTWAHFAREASLHPGSSNARRILTPRKTKLLDQISAMNEWDIHLFTEARKLFYHDLFVYHHKHLANSSKHLRESIEHEKRRSRFYRSGASVTPESHRADDDDDNDDDGSSKKLKNSKRIRSENHENGKHGDVESGSQLHAKFVMDYVSLRPDYASMVGVLDFHKLRLKFPSLFLHQTSKGSTVWKAAFNLRNDEICEGYFVTAVIDEETFALIENDTDSKSRKKRAVAKRTHKKGLPTSPFGHSGRPNAEHWKLRKRISPASVGDDDNNNKTSERFKGWGELLDTENQVSVLGFDFFRGGHGHIYTGAEDGRVITSPTGNLVYFVFNAKTPDRKRQMAVLDYNLDPGHAVFLTIRGMKTRSTEKNWTPFFLSLEQQEEQDKGEEILYFVYTLSPTVILRCSTLEQAIRNQKDKVDCDVVEHLSNLPEDGKDVSQIDHFSKRIIVRGSSPLVEYEWPYYIGLVHSRVPSLEGNHKGRVWKPCYRTLLMVMDISIGRPVHLSNVINFSSQFVKNFDGPPPWKRETAQDTYNHYATALFPVEDAYEEERNDRNIVKKWYFGVDFDDCHPVIGELTNLEEYMQQHWDSFERPFKEGQHDLLNTRDLTIHDAALSKPFIRSCSINRMKHPPDWGRKQGRCKAASGKKPRLPWKDAQLYQRK